MMGLEWTTETETRSSRVLICAAVLCVVVLTTLGLLHIPLQVDGGWYSYPAVAWVLHGDPYAYQLPFEEAVAASGSRVLFHYETTSSVRVLYTAAAISLFGASRETLLFVSLAEYSLLVYSAFRVYCATFQSRHLVLMAALLVAVDLSILVPAVTDFRPDNAVAAFSLILYWLLVPAKLGKGRLSAAVVMAVLAVFTAATAPIPIVFVVVALLTEAWLTGGQDGRRKFIEVILVGSVAVACFLGRSALFELLLQPERAVVSPVDPIARMMAKWSYGPFGVLDTEVERWRRYLSGANIAVGLGTICAMWGTVLAARRRRMSPRIWGTLCGLVCAGLFVALADAHATPSHLVPLVPFIWLLFTSAERTDGSWRRFVLPTLAALACVASFGLAMKWGAELVRSGSRISRIAQMLQRLPTRGERLILIGPTELWPYLPVDRTVVMVDWIRDPAQIAEYRNILGQVQYVVLNKDYGWDSWSRTLTAIPESEFSQVSDDSAPLRIFQHHERARVDSSP